MKKKLRSLLLPLLVYSFLTILVWGLFAADRGLWRDDVFLTAGAAERVIQHPGTGLVGDITRLGQAGGNLRCLRAIPYALAVRTGNPRLFLQLVYGLSWLGIGIAAWGVAKELFPKSRATAFTAGALAICATGDNYTNSIGSLNYNLCTLAFFLALWCLLCWQRTRRPTSLIGSAILISISVWHAEAAVTSIALLPLLLWVACGFRITWRTIIAGAVWLLVLAPFVIECVNVLGASGSYHSNIMGREDGISSGLTLKLFLHNFAPWLWARKRAYFGWKADDIIPTFFAVCCSVLGTTAYLGVALRMGRKQAERLVGKRAALREALLVVVCVVMALAVNAVFARIPLGARIHRTQLVSRIWASLAIAALFGMLYRWLHGRSSAGIRACRFAAFVIPVTFVCLGILGGIERQSYFLSAWRRQRKELASILRAVPAMRANARMILYFDRSSPPLSMRPLSLARTWCSLLYRDPTVAERLHTTSGGGSSVCIPETNGLRFVYRNWKRRKEEVIPYDEVIVVTYDAQKHQFGLATRLPSVRRLHGEDVESLYNPSALILNEPTSRLAETLLAGDVLLGRLIPSDSSDECADP